MSLERILLVAVCGLLIVGASTFPGQWFEAEELRLVPVDAAPVGRCYPEGALIYVKGDGGHLCVCTRQHSPLAMLTSEPDWLRADGGGACPDATYISR